MPSRSAIAQARSSEASAFSVSISARCDLDTPTTAANSACVMSSITRVSRQRRANEIRKGVGTPRFKQSSLTYHLLDRL
jgi:hypothetical protein